MGSQITAAGSIALKAGTDRVVMDRLPDNSEAKAAISAALKEGTLVKGVAYVDKATGKLNMVRIDPAKARPPTPLPAKPPAPQALKPTPKKLGG